MKNNIIYFILFIFCVACTTPQPRKPIARKTSTFLKESIERNKILNKAEEEAFLNLIEEDSMHTYLSSSSGFWYYYNIQNTTSSILPKTGDKVQYTYEIRDINRQVIYSYEELGERNYLVDKQELISGLQDGLKLMKEGEELTFLFPSHKAYGYSGYQKINSGQPLIYTVRLNKIIPNQ